MKKNNWEFFWFEKNKTRWKKYFSILEFLLCKRNYFEKKKFNQKIFHLLIASKCIEKMKENFMWKKKLKCACVFNHSFKYVLLTIDDYLWLYSTDMFESIVVICKCLFDFEWFLWMICLWILRERLWCFIAFKPEMSRKKSI